MIALLVGAYAWGQYLHHNLTHATGATYWILTIGRPVVFILMTAGWVIEIWAHRQSVAHLRFIPSHDRTSIRSISTKTIDQVASQRYDRHAS